MKQDTWDSIDTFDGAHLTVEATFLDGKTESRTYTLSTGRLRLDRYENGTWTVLPQLAGDEEAYVYGIYAVSEEESRWFQWPVEGAIPSASATPSEPDGIPADGENRPQWDRHSSRRGTRCWRRRTHRDGDRL